MKELFKTSSTTLAAKMERKINLQKDLKKKGLNRQQKSNKRADIQRLYKEARAEGQAKRSDSHKKLAALAKTLDLNAASAPTTSPEQVMLKECRDSFDAKLSQTSPSENLSFENTTAQLRDGKLMQAIVYALDYPSYTSALVKLDELAISIDPTFTAAKLKSTKDNKNRILSCTLPVDQKGNTVKIQATHNPARPQHLTLTATFSITQKT